MTSPSETTLPSPRPSFWRTLREAALGTHAPHDYTAGPIGRSIFLLAVPMVLEMMMESIFAVVDVFWVAHLGADAVATVGVTESLMVLIYTLAMGLSIGAMALVARRIGEKDRDAAARAAVQAIVLGSLVAGVVSALGAFFAPELLALMGAPQSVQTTGVGFTRVMLGGSATVFLLFVINAIFRGAGDAAVALRVLMLANALNIVLGPLFIFGYGPFPELGVQGAAVATTIGRGVGVLFALSRLMKGSGHLAVRRHHLGFEPAVMGRILRLSGTATLQVLIGAASWIGLVRILAGFGAPALAGYTITIRIVLFALMPAFGLGNAAATMVGQSLGAGNPERAEASVWTAARYNVIFLGLTGLAFLIGAPWVVRIFTQDPAVVPFATLGLRVIAIGFPLFAYGMVLTQSFNGAGDTWTPTRINFGVFWLFEIPLAWFLTQHTALGAGGVFYAVTIAYTVFAGVSVVMFRRGRWKRKRV